jgi:hypothetical protein
MGSARLGSARLGSARLGSARLGSARLGSAILLAFFISHCTGDESSPAPDTGAGISSDATTRGFALSEGSGDSELFYCDPPGTDARFHWQLEGSGANPEPDCDGSGAPCPPVTNHGSTYDASGRLAAARTFDGSSWIDLGDAGAANGSPGTISLWFNRADAVGGQFLAGRIEAVEPYRGWMIGFDADNRLAFTLQHDNDTGAGADALIVRTPNAVIDTADWHHVMVSWSWGPGGAMLADDVVMTLDGTAIVLDVVSNTLANTIATAAPMTLGARRFDASGAAVTGTPSGYEPDYFNGQIDDVRFFDHALRAPEAANLQGVRLDADPRQCGTCDNTCVSGFACVDGACTAPSCPTGLQLWLDFEEGDGRQVYGRIADDMSLPSRVLSAAIDERHWPSFDPLDTPFVDSPLGGESAFRFNGTAGLTLQNAAGDIYALNDHSFSQGLTLSMWVRPETGAADTMLISSIEPDGDELGWYLGLDSSRQLVFISRDSATTYVQVRSTGTLSVDQWTHVVFTFSEFGPASGAFYLGGVSSLLIEDHNTALSEPPVYVPVVLGGRTGDTDVFVGAIDRVLVMSSGLAATQVAPLANAASSIDACAPSHELGCSEGSGSCDGWSITGCETNLAGEGSGIVGWVECNSCGVFGPSCDQGHVVDPFAQENCDTPADDDGDGDINCDDSDCVGFAFCAGNVEWCFDGIDNDGSGGIDCADSACADDYYCSTRETDCGDGIDNDGDFLIDQGIDTDFDGIWETDPDPDCYERFATGLSYEICDDRISNNGTAISTATIQIVNSRSAASLGKGIVSTA